MYWIVPICFPFRRAKPNELKKERPAPASCEAGIGLIRAGHMLRTLPHDTNWEQRIRQVAYEYWEERGRPIGSSEVGWFRAEKEIDRQGQTASEIQNELGTALSLRKTHQHYV